MNNSLELKTSSYWAGAVFRSLSHASVFSQATHLFLFQFENLLLDLGNLTVNAVHALNQLLLGEFGGRCVCILTHLWNSTWGRALHLHTKLGVLSQKTGRKKREHKNMYKPSNNPKNKVNIGLFYGMRKYWNLLHPHTHTHTLLPSWPLQWSSCCPVWSVAGAVHCRWTELLESAFQIYSPCGDAWPRESPAPAELGLHETVAHNHVSALVACRIWKRYLELQLLCFKNLSIKQYYWKYHKSISFVK